MTADEALERIREVLASEWSPDTLDEVDRIVREHFAASVPAPRPTPEGRFNRVPRGWCSLHGSFTGPRCACGVKAS